MSTQSRPRSLSGTFTADGQSAGLRANQGFVHIDLRGTFGAVVTPQYSNDEGTTWHSIGPDLLGTPQTLAGPVSAKVASQDGQLWRLDCDWTSGTVEYELTASS